LALTSPTSGGRSVGIVRSPTQVTELSFYLTLLYQLQCLYEYVIVSGEFQRTESSIRKKSKAIPVTGFGGL
jgi:hypothetical protein